MSEEETELGELRVSVGKLKSEQTVYTLKVDRLAAAKDGRVYLLSVAGAAGEVKGLRAAMNAAVPATLELSGVEVACSDPEEDGHARHARNLRADDVHKYDVYSAPLGFGVTHALFLSRAPGFLRTVTDEAVWRELKRPEFTTPLLRSWAGTVRDELKRLGMLKPLYCAGCTCAVISAQTADLDKIVEAGVQAGTLPFRDSA